MGAALIRLVRVLIAQRVNIPYLNISAGAVLNALAKFLRDRYKWAEFLPV